MLLWHIHSLKEKNLYKVEHNKNNVKSIKVIQKVLIC